jgi:hypothetical protein
MFGAVIFKYFWSTTVYLSVLIVSAVGERNRKLTTNQADQRLLRSRRLETKIDIHVYMIQLRNF